MKTWTLKVNEEELQWLIMNHCYKHSCEDKPDAERSARIHDLTKRLNKETPEIEQKEAEQEQVTQTQDKVGW